MKAAICDVMAAEDMTAEPQDIVVTTGGQQAIDLIAKSR